MEREDRALLSYLNSCQSSNLFGNGRDRNAAKDFISDYFTADHAVENWSDSDEDSDEECGDGLVPPRGLAKSTVDCENSDDSDDSDTTDETKSSPTNVGIVSATNEIKFQVVGAAECADDVACNGAPSPAMLANAHQWSCHCKQIKVASKTAGDHRSGCIAQFTPDEIVEFQLSIQDMSREAKDILVIGMVAMCIRTGDKTECTRRKEQKDRQKSRSSYILMGKSVCSKTFCKLVCIGDQKLKTLCKHYKEFGLVPRNLKSGGRKNNTKALSLPDTERVVDFIKGYAQHHAVSLPGRVPGFKRDDIQLLPSAETKSGIFRLYRASCQNAGHRHVSASTFRKLWLQLCPFIVVTRPLTDLCWRCQQNTTQIFRGANLTLEEKQALMEKHQQHLSQVDAERQLYRDMVASSKATVTEHAFANLGPSVPNSKDIRMHYSFDFAQQVHYPSWPDQPGPMYFLTPRKCSIFGICCEGFPKQINYLIDESVNVSKGSNAVISYLHHFFENFAVGEMHVDLHRDNCSGQNKNKFVLWYCAWRVMRGLHTSITVNFMPPGHTKFSPDWCFGLLKRCFRRTPVHCLEDLCRVVSSSTPESGVNIPQLVGREDWSVTVPTYDWQNYLKPACFEFRGIKKCAHFRFSAERPGFVFFKSGLLDEEQSRQLVKPAGYQGLAAMPLALPPPGLDYTRQNYLYTAIREFVKEEHKDTVCPPPQEDRTEE
ncbi:uncharacterized protein LOC143285915 [Babylonia areolata]|uniref:uncharacterized protein LOC143285869 n=1 Tax=Babylonia areolata TaxID=304850 RepID=UPI003FCF53B7